jgi:RNA polymerase sigma factor (sigma-70 family)
MARIGPDELTRLFDDHAPALALYARQLCDTPEDVVQEAFVRLARQRHVPDHPRDWLYRVVRNGAISASRAAKRRRRREAAASRDERWFASTDDRLAMDDAVRLLKELEADVREVIVARLWGGLTFDEIARLQDCSVTTAFRRYQQALQHLQKKLESPCPNLSIPLDRT